MYFIAAPANTVRIVFVDTAALDYESGLCVSDKHHRETEQDSFCCCL